MLVAIHEIHRLSFYSLVIANRVLKLDAVRMKLACKLNDGMDYVPTNKYVLFGHHFAAIAGAGPLVGPIELRKWVHAGYGSVVWRCVCWNGTRCDRTIHIHRRDGRSLDDLIKSELGQLPWHDSDVWRVPFFINADLASGIGINCSDGTE